MLRPVPERELEASPANLPQPCAVEVARTTRGFLRSVCHSAPARAVPIERTASVGCRLRKLSATKDPKARQSRGVETPSKQLRPGRRVHSAAVQNLPSDPLYWRTVSSILPLGEHLRN
jgi:hypothetical protein